MKTISPSLALLMNISTVQARMSRRFDGCLGSLGFTEFAILFHLEQSVSASMRRVDLAEQLGLTASGITRLLAPMEKIGLIQREVNPRDARVSSVSLAPGGKRMLQETLENAEELATRLLADVQKSDIQQASELLRRIGGTV